jgi:hypothetical protein
LSEEFAMKVIFECKSGTGTPLNAKKFSTKLKPGYCFGMTIDWARTSLKLNGVKALNMLDPGKWPIIQSAYEMNQHKLGAPDEVGMIAANGLDVNNGDGKGEEVIFNRDFKVLAQQLAGKVGTFIFILFGEPGAGAHFMGFRRKGVGEFLLAEFFDPNDGLISFASELEFREYLGGYLDHAYAGRQPPVPALDQYCGLSQVTLA